jgi:mevalonate kinase
VTRHIGLGKVILLGEHAVVYGYPALVAALDRGVTAAALPTPAGGTLRLDVPAWRLAVHASSKPDAEAPARALAAIADALAVARPAVTILAETQLPPRAGIGSSAALAVATARALAAHTGKQLTAAALADAATAAERVFHGTPSGIDVAIAMAGGLGVFRKATGLRQIGTPPLRVIVGPPATTDGSHAAAIAAGRSTREMVDLVAAAVSHDGNDARLRALGALTDDGADALLGRDLARLGAAMDRAHAMLAGLGVSTPQLDALCAAARAAGAHGAKLTGAGGGGSVIAVATADREAAVLAAWKTSGVTGFVAQVGR